MLFTVESAFLKLKINNLILPYYYLSNLTFKQCKLNWKNTCWYTKYFQTVTKLSELF